MEQVSKALEKKSLFPLVLLFVLISKWAFVFDGKEAFISLCFQQDWSELSNIAKIWQFEF